MDHMQRSTDSERGYIIVVVLLLLALLSVAGVTASRRGVSDLAVATNRQNKELSFQAADSGIHYVAGREAELFGDTNVLPGSGLPFPNATVGVITLSSIQEFNGRVIYQNAGNAPRGAGYEVGKFNAHYYDCATAGHGPRDAQSCVVVRFYRISPSGL
jgi:hypothetical protein